MALPKKIIARHLRRLRHPHRLGEGHHRRLREGGRPRRLHDRPRRAHPDLPRDLARDRGRLLRALRRGAAPHGGRDRQAPGLAAGALALGLPARLRPALAGLQGDQHAAQQVHQEVPDRAHLEHRRQAAGPDAPPHPARLRPRRHRPAGALLQARPRALQRVRAADRDEEGLGPRLGQLLPRRRAGAQEQDPRDLGQPQEGDPRAGPEEADRRGQEPPRSGQAPGPARGRCESSACTTTCSSRRAASGRRRARSCATATRASSSTRRSSPTSSRSCRPCSSRPSSPSPGCWPRTATGTTCSAGSPSRARRSASPRRPPRA